MESYKDADSTAQFYSEGDHDRGTGKGWEGGGSCPLTAYRDTEKQDTFLSSNTVCVCESHRYIIGIVLYPIASNV